MRLGIRLDALFFGFPADHRFYKLVLICFVDFSKF